MPKNHLISARYSNFSTHYIFKDWNCLRFGIIFTGFEPCLTFLNFNCPPFFPTFSFCSTFSRSRFPNNFSNELSSKNLNFQNVRPRQPLNLSSQKSYNCFISVNSEPRSAKLGLQPYGPDAAGLQH